MSTKPESTALAPVERAALALKTAERTDILKALVKESADLVEIRDKASREQVHGAYKKLRNTRLEIVRAAEVIREDAQRFNLAMLGEQRILLAITDPEEERLKTLRDAFDQKAEAERQAKADELRKKLEALQAGIAAIKAIPQAMIGKPSADIEAVIINLQERVIEFGDLQAEAAIALATEEQTEEIAA